MSDEITTPKDRLHAWWDQGPIVPSRPLLVIAGPCVLESDDVNLQIAKRMKVACDAAGAMLVFKASFDKANRSSIRSDRGPGLERGLQQLELVGREFDVPLLTDVHEASQAMPASEVVDILQIPAFLCRQTDLLVACGRPLLLLQHADIKNRAVNHARCGAHIRHSVDHVGQTVGSVEVVAYPRHQ